MKQIRANEFVVFSVQRLFLDITTNGVKINRETLGSGSRARPTPGARIPAGRHRAFSTADAEWRMKRPLMSALLEMRGIVRCYGAVRANDGVDLEVRSGEILGLLGENGSGKSTLMKVLFGMTPADEGAIVFRGRALAGHKPADAMEAGIAMIHQHFMLIEAMTIVENVMLGWPDAGAHLEAPRDGRPRERGEPTPGP